MILTGLIATRAFKTQSISNNLSLSLSLKSYKNLEPVNLLSDISIVSSSLNDDLTKIR